MNRTPRPPSSVLASLLVAIAVLLAACVPSAPSAPGLGGQPRRGGILRASTLGDPPPVLHPCPEAQQYTVVLVDAGTLMGSGLLSFDWERIDFIVDEHSLARELPRISEDGRTFTFTLRDDIKWSDGTRITSADFQFAWDNCSKRENNWVGLTTIERIEAFQTPDPRTIVVTLKQRLARFVAMTTASVIGPIPKHVWEGKPWSDPQGNPEILKPTVVEGPYLPNELSAERHSYRRNGNYWGTQPNLEEVAFITASATTIVELLRTKQVEWARNVPAAQYEDAKTIPHANVVEWAGATGLYRVVQFNLRRPLLADKRFREALVRAINRNDLIQFEEGLAVAQHGLFPVSNTRWLNDRLERYDLDLNRSRQLLAEAGFRLEGGVLRAPDGQAVRLEIIWPTTSPPRGKMGAYMQQQWKELGIETTVTGLEFNAFVDKYQRQRDFDVAMGSFGGGSPDPDVAKSQYKSDGTQNAMGYNNPRVDELLEAGVVELDDAKRKEIYDEIQRIVITDLPVFYLVTLKSVTAFDKKIGGVFPRKGGDILQDNNRQFMQWFVAE